MVEHLVYIQGVRGSSPLPPTRISGCLLSFIYKMKIVICGSITESKYLIEAAKELEGRGIDVVLPYSTKKIMDGEIKLEEYRSIKESRGDSHFRERARKGDNKDFIKRYFREISRSDAILVVNTDKKGIKNYIGGNVLMEIGFAYVLGKKIYLLNGIPDVSYKDEIVATKPIILNGDLTKIVEK